MKYAIWFGAFVCLCVAAITGLAVGIKVLQPEWFCVTIFAVTSMFSLAEIADKNFED